VKENPVRFAVAYGLLGIVVALAAAGFVLGLVATTGKASNASVVADRARIAKAEAALNPTVESAIVSACAYAENDANSQGVVITECKLYKPEAGEKPNPEVDGDTVTVALVVRLSTGDYYVVGVKMNKGIYQPVGQLQVIPAGKKSPPSRGIS